MISKISAHCKDYARYLRYLPFLDAVAFSICKFSKKNKVKKTIVGGVSVSLRTNSPDLIVAVSSFVKKEYDSIKITHPKVIIDGGANIGTSAMFFAKKFPNATVYAVEMEEGNLEMLSKNAEKFPNIIVITAALGARNEKRAIRNRFTGQWGYTIANTNNPTEEISQVVDVITIDCMMDRYSLQYIDLIKLDIEGSEKEIFDHPGDWIEKTGIIAAELHDRIVSGCTESFQKATKSFQDFETMGEKIVAYKQQTKQRILTLID